MRTGQLVLQVTNIRKQQFALLRLRNILAPPEPPQLLFVQFVLMLPLFSPSYDWLYRPKFLQQDRIVLVLLHLDENALASTLFGTFGLLAGEVWDSLARRRADLPEVDEQQLVVIVYVHLPIFLSLCHGPLGL